MNETDRKGKRPLRSEKVRWILVSFADRKDSLGLCRYALRIQGCDKFQFLWNFHLPEFEIKILHKISDQF